MAHSIVRNTILGLIVTILAALGLSVSLAWAAPSNEGDTFAAQSFDLTTATDSTTITSGALTVSRLDNTGAIARGQGITSFYFEISVAQEALPATVTVSPANTDIVKLTSGSNSIELSGGYYSSAYCDCTFTGYGSTTITVTCGSDKVEFDVLHYREDCAAIWDASKYSYSQVLLQWTPRNSATGFYVQRAKSSGLGTVDGPFKTIKTVPGGYLSTIVEANWDVPYIYRIVPFADFHSIRYESTMSDHSATYKEFTLPSPTLAIKSVTQSGAKAMTVAWKAEKGATKFMVYRSTSENRGYKKVATTTKKTFTDKKRTKGTVYYYRVKAVFNNKSSYTSKSYAKLVKKKSGVLRKKLYDMTYWAYAQASYGGYIDENTWTPVNEIGSAHPDRMFYYTQGSRLYAVHYSFKRLKVYTITAAGNIKSSRTVDLPDHTYWGGFYHGPDGNNYVAIGYGNPKESAKKTVVKVIKYNKNWKKGKTALIKGKMKNDNSGIKTPFRFGSSSFSMSSDGTLYMAMSRIMFVSRDGIAHQSGDSFAINTKTMKAKKADLAMASHSVNQLVRIKDGSIYSVEHGDAYPRAIRLLMRNRYGTSTASSKSVEAFQFEGRIGDNATGATLGGMEVGNKYVLLCGTAQPHGYEVGNCLGYGGFKENVFVARVDRETGDSKVLWITRFNPDGGKKTVGECRMVKISDDHFALLYTVTDDNTRAKTFYYVSISNTGKKLLTKTYANMDFSSASQPVLMNGSIYWIEYAHHVDETPMLYRIPAL